MKCLNAFLYKFYGGKHSECTFISYYYSRTFSKKYLQQSAEFHIFYKSNFSTINLILIDTINIEFYSTVFSFQNGVFFGPVASVPILLFSGFFVNFNTIPGYLQWVPYVSYIRYGFEGAMISIYGYGREKLSCSEAYCHFRSPTKFLEEMDMATAEYWIDAVALGGFFLVLRCVAYFVLRLKLRSKK